MLVGAATSSREPMRHPLSFALSIVLVCLSRLEKNARVSAVPCITL
jgi:hypothetical protein